jgi:5-methylcytosine-specific restriction endonuclease McrA
MKYFIRKATRTAIFQEYNGACAACGCADHRALQIDHATSRKHGGSDELENLQVLCYVCNTQIKRENNTPKMKPRRAEYDCRKWEKARRAFTRRINGDRK